MDKQTLDKTMREERKVRIRQLIDSPGWLDVEKHIVALIEKSEQIKSIDTTNDDTIILSVRLAQSRIAAYNSLLNWIKQETINKEDKNGGSTNTRAPN